jgi:hypothetical protein
MRMRTSDEATLAKMVKFFTDGVYYLYVQFRQRKFNCKLHR